MDICTCVYAYKYFYIYVIYIIYTNAAGLVALGPLAPHRSQDIMFKGRYVDRNYMYITSIITSIKTYIDMYMYMWIYMYIYIYL